MPDTIGKQHESQYRIAASQSAARATRRPPGLEASRAGLEAALWLVQPDLARCDGRPQPRLFALRALIGKTMIQISNQEYAGLVAARDAMQAALHRFADVVEANERSGEDCVPWHLKDVTAADISDAVLQARGVLVEHGVGVGVEPAWARQSTTATV
jgi:hypothetical protein